MVAPGLRQARYRDRAAPPEERLADLLGRMTRTEKIAQLGATWAFEIVGDDGVLADRLADRLGPGIGEITRLAGSTNLDPAAVALAGNQIQRYLVEETRLGIPAIIHEETLHGLLARDAPCFQQSIGAAATFDPELVRSVAASIRQRMLATGARHALAPVLDIGRDPRWGRIEETYGEDPYLASVMGIAYVRGIQGDGEDGTVIATGKHLVGHGLAEGGLNQAPAHVGPRELRDEQLLPFEAAVREAGLASVMPAYCDVDGMPAHASLELLETIVRGEWGFDGIVSADYIGIEMLVTSHRITTDHRTAAALALRAGVDLDLPASGTYRDHLSAAIDAGLVDERCLDLAVARVLRAKFRLGLFERPYVDVPDAATFAVLADLETPLARELAVRSVVLLENDGVLPIRADVGSIAVIGPLADSARDLIGDYSHDVHLDSLLEMRQSGNPLGITSHAPISQARERPARRTVLDAIREQFGGRTVRHARGSGLRDGEPAELAEAVAAARDSDVAVMVLGERSGLTLDSTTGEFRDRRDLGFIGRQQELLEAVVATGTPVVLVVVSGRPLAIEWAAQHCAAIVWAWVPGDAGPDAIADVLAGTANPGGKLPITVPRNVGQVPRTYRHHPSGGRSNPRGDYVDGPVSPLWPFGFGRSYTTFALEGLALSASAMPTNGGCVEISAEVANTGDRAGDEVVQLYVRDEEAQVARPVRELRGFRRVTLKPGGRSRVTFAIHAEQLAYTGADYRRIVEPGSIHLAVGTSSADLPLVASVELTGPIVEVPVRTRYVTATTVEPIGS